MFLHCSAHDTPKTWSKWLPLAELWYNTSYHASLQCSPIKALYGVDPTPGFVPSIKLADHPGIADILKERQIFTKLLKNNLAKA
jgi:hypothetical protein